MQLINFVLTAIVAGTTLVSASSPDSNVVAKRHDEIRALDSLYGRNNGHISKRHANKRSKTCKAKSSVKSVKTTEVKTSSNSTASLKGLNGNKIGLCWPMGSSQDIGPYSKASWLYSWDSTPGGDFVPDDMMFFPMLWGNGGDKISAWKKNVLNNRNSKYNKDKIAMGPNEVNQDHQGKMSPGQACDLFRSYLLPLKNEDGWKLIGPSTTSAPDGKTWMKQFKSDCPDVWKAIDYDSVHYYGTSSDNAINYVKDWYQTFQRPIFVTEIADMNYDGKAYPSPDDVVNFGKAFMNYAASADYILGVAWYAPIPKDRINIVHAAALSEDNGTPTPLWHTLTNILN